MYLSASSSRLAKETLEQTTKTINPKT